jgi:signal transduction histidine kinase
MQSIRAHITAWAFAVFAVLVMLQGALVLGALERGLLRLADADLREELEERVSEAGDAGLAELLARGDAADPRWSDLAFELRDELERAGRAADPGESLLYEIRRESGPLVAASAALAGAPRTPVSEPALGALSSAADGATVRDGVRYSLAADPRGPGRLRVAQVTLGPYQLAIARSLTPMLRIQEAVRRDLAVILAGVCVVGVAGAFWIATGGLAPMRRLAREAERLGSLAEGSLPRTGRNDEVDALARILNDLLDRLREEVTRTRRFTADAAHEIRTPLSAIRGHLELLLGKVEWDARLSLESVLEEVDRLSRLVNRLLLLEKLEAEPPDARGTFRPLDLGRLAADLAQHLAVLAEERGIDLCCDVEVAHVNGDAERLRQVFLNLLDNAFEHTPAGGRVTVRVARAGARVRAVVEDTGPGVPPERLERIFDRFSSDRSRPTAGTGLGLPIARAIARAHGGELRAASPAGAVLTLDLPAAA